MLQQFSVTVFECNKIQQEHIRINNGHPGQTLDPFTPFRALY